ALCLVVIVGGLAAFEFLGSMNKIHHGVSVAGIDLSGLTVDEAEDLLDTELIARADSADVTVYRDDTTLAASGVLSAASDQAAAASGSADSAADGTTSGSDGTTASTPTSGSADVAADAAAAVAAVAGPTAADSTTAASPASSASPASNIAPPLELNSDLAPVDGSDADPVQQLSWGISTSTLGVSVDGRTMAEEAYAVGRGASALAERWQAWVSGVVVPSRLSYDPTQLAGLEQIINQAVGTPAVNADIDFQDGAFAVVAAVDGVAVQDAEFTQALDDAFLGSTRYVVPLMGAVAPLISTSQAQDLATYCQQAIASPVDLTYEDSGDWSLDSNLLGSVIATSVDTSQADAVLQANVSADKLKDSIDSLVGSQAIQVAPQNASFTTDGNTVTIVPSVDGRGIDYQKLATDLEKILFPAPGSGPVPRQVAMGSTTLAPDFSTADAEAMHITKRISTFTTQYGFSTAARATNVQVAANILNNALVAPQSTWSFNATVGDPTVDRGFVTSKVISGSEYVDAVGGGVCQVATTTFNAVYDAGYPIVSRANHALYQFQYPDGRDAAVYYPWLDFQWQNDTDNWILIRTGYDGKNLTVSLYGTDPGYRVESTTGPWQPGKDFAVQKTNNPDLEIGQEVVTQAGVNGKKISVTRKVYDASGALLRDTTFNSVYDPVDEKIDVGTKPVAPAADTPSTGGSSTGAADNSGSGSGSQATAPDSGGTDNSTANEAATSGSTDQKE
ncbi:MAG: VanW family protein, partial [Coriobacteriia bacterium]|nr:VanW family protein [Coriobacteriia bacterium]